MLGQHIEEVSPEEMQRRLYGAIVVMLGDSRRCAPAGKYQKSKQCDRQPSLHEDSAQQRVRCDPRTRIWHIDSRPGGTKNATKAALEAGFRQLDTSERYRTEKEVGEAMQEVFRRRGRSSGRTCLSPPSSGTTIIVLNAPNPHSRPVSRNSNSTTSISTSSTPLCLPNLETSKTRGMQRQCDL